MRTRLILIIASLLCVCSVTVSMADQIAIAEDGREVRLKDDGTWEYMKAEQKEHRTTPSTGNYIRIGSIGKVPKPKKKPVIHQSGDFPLRKIESWVGEEFIFLPTGKNYKLLKGKKDGTYNTFDTATWFMNLPYKEYVGRIAIVRSVSKEKSPVGGDWIVELEMTDTKEKLYVKTRLRKISGIGPVADIDKARDAWLNKYLWCSRKGMTLSTFDENTKKIGTFPILRYGFLYVIGVVAGEGNEKPVRFILRTTFGEEGYVDIDLSGTNASNIRKVSPLAGIFLTENPRKRGWSEKEWTAIMGAKVFIGMTAEQVRMSWGTPRDVNKTITGAAIHEQWVYGTGSYLYFDDGILTSMQQ